MLLTDTRPTSSGDVTNSVLIYAIAKLELDATGDNIALA